MRSVSYRTVRTQFLLVSLVLFLPFPVGKDQKWLASKVPRVAYYYLAKTTKQNVCVQSFLDVSLIILADSDFVHERICFFKLS
jgi:hypothetical protein